ncbi:MAG: hypothetical protein ABI810_03550 [Sphingomonas bacterium]
MTQELILVEMSITTLEVDAIVNAANSSLRGGNDMGSIELARRAGNRGRLTG